MKHSLIFLLSCLPALLFAQSPWARNKAGFYVQAAYYFIPSYTTLFGENGEDIVLERAVSEKQIQLYGEYGISKKSTLILSLPVVFNARGASNPSSPYMFEQEDSGRIAGMGNASIALRHQVLQGNVAFSGTLKLGFPAAKAYKSSTDLRTGYDALTLEPLLSVGKGFRKSYAFLYGGYGYRSNHYSHYLHAGAEAGLHLGQFWLTGFSDLIVSLENGTRKIPAVDVLTGLYVNDQGWISLGAKLTWEINRFVGITLSGAGAAWAQYVPKSPGIGAAIYFKWD